MEQATKDKEQTAKVKEHASKDKAHASKDKEHATKDKEHATKDKEQATKDKEQATKDKEQATKDKEQVTKDKDQATKDKEQTTKEKEQAAKDVAPKAQDDDFATFSKKDKEVLEKKYYEEEDEVGYLLATKKKAQDMEHIAHRALDWIIRLTFSLTMIAAMLTAMFSYMTFQLPASVYSHHILREIFLAGDNLMAANGISKDPGLHLVTPFPVTLLVLYAIVINFIYAAQYPKARASVRYVRYTAFGIMEFYLFVCAISYIIDTCNVGSRLDVFFERDKVGFTPGDIHGDGLPLHFLDNSQEYFACCGYRNRLDWADTFPENYTGKWPLSCCSPEISGIACFNPVEETVHYKPPSEDDEHDADENDPGGGGGGDENKPEEGEGGVDKDGFVTKPRLHEVNCFDKEFELSIISACFILIPLFIFMFVALTTFILTIIVSSIMFKYNIKTTHQFGF